MSDKLPSKTMPLRAGVETGMAVLLAGLGIWHIWKVKEPDAWTGFALIGLALLFYLMRGQIITKLAVSKEGIEAELAALEQKVEATAEKAEAAQQDAALAKGVATQFAGPPSPPDTSGQPSERGESDGAEEAVAGDPPSLTRDDPWAHPTLQRGPKPRDDPQKNQWGGQPARNGRELDAEVVPVDDDWYDIFLSVSALPNAPPLTNRVRFHLHDTFRKSVVTVRPKNGVAKLKRYAWGAFTVGAEVEHEPETFLELDMAAEDFDAPRPFKAR